MSLFSRSIPKRRTVLVVTLDAPSGKAEAALALPYGDKITVLASSSSLSGALKRPLRLSLEGVLAALSKEIHANNLPLPREACVVVSAPSYLASTEIVRYGETEDFKITPELVHSLLETSRDKKERGSRGPSHLLALSVNGHPALRPYELFGKTLELYLLNTSLDVKVQETARDSLNKFFQLPVFVAPYALAAAISLSRNPSMRETENSLLALQVSERTTEVLLLEKGILLETVSFPVGSQDLFASVGRVLKVVQSLAGDTLRLLNRGYLHRISGFPRAAGREWISQLERVVETLGESASVPHGLILFAAKELEPFLHSLLANSFLRHRSARGLSVRESKGMLPLITGLPLSIQGGIMPVALAFAAVEREPLPVSTRIGESVVVR